MCLDVTKLLCDVLNRDADVVQQRCFNNLINKYIQFLSHDENFTHGPSKFFFHTMPLITGMSVTYLYFTWSKKTFFFKFCHFWQYGPLTAYLSCHSIDKHDENLD